MAAWSIRMPVYAACFMVFTLANVGLPGTSGFVGEFLTLLGAFQVNTWVAIFAATGVILSAAYMLYLYRRVVFGQAGEAERCRPSRTLSLREVAILAPLVIITIADGRLSQADLRCDQRLGRQSDPATQNGAGRDPRARTRGRDRQRRPAVNGFADSVSILLPELILAVGALGLLLLGALRGDNDTKTISFLSVVAMAVAAYVMLAAGPGTFSAFHGAFVVDGFARFAKVLILLGRR